MASPEDCGFGPASDDEEDMFAVLAGIQRASQQTISELGPLPQPPPARKPSPSPAARRSAKKRRRSHATHSERPVKRVKSDVKPAAPAAGPLDRAHLLFCPLGRLLSARRRKLFTSKAAINGATVVAKLLPAVTHVIIGGDVAKAALLSWAARTRADKAADARLLLRACHLVTPEWLAESLRTSSRVEPSQFEWGSVGDDDDDDAGAEEKKDMDDMPLVAAARLKAGLPSLAEPQSSAAAAAVAAAAATAPAMSAPAPPPQPPRKRKLVVSIDSEDMVGDSEGVEAAHAVGVDGSARSLAEHIASMREGGDVSRFLARNPWLAVSGRAAARAARAAPYFACVRSGRTEFVNENEALTSQLSPLIAIYEVLGDVWRQYTYRKVVGILKASKQVRSAADALKLRGIGSSIADKIGEILETGRLRKKDELLRDARVQRLLAFTGIWGVGVVKARELLREGFTSIADLRARLTDKTLTSQQRVGLRHYEDLKQRLPRDEVVAIEGVIADALSELHEGLTLTTCGSYRRGLPSSGDVDILISDPQRVECTILPQLVRHLHDRGFLVDDLVTPGEHVPGGCQTYMGVCRLPGGRARRLDLKTYPRAQYPFAILYFTGSDHFNRSMRLYARKIGLTLSDKGLAAAARRDGVRIWEGCSVRVRNEREIFEALGLVYKQPHERNCFAADYADAERKEAKNAARRQKKQQRRK